ncbi:hypothetical protein [Phyllobacterium myrsinacearum]|uniref:Uncharacterized protein n=1 Tax=Phyllobacterium myrsinacearum TaxID=28101 RepID=A0A839ES76_9HYPH|nr:hypothetical protein [Phyllobacterium myrsinacearum]MBA8881779.1 hypothetical protein [Phyllobacterium myrsinacearum]
MQRYMVRLERSITAKPHVTVEVDAHNPDEAGIKALQLAKANALEWTEALGDQVSSTIPTVQSIELVVDYDDVIDER